MSLDQAMIAAAYHYNTVTNERIRTAAERAGKEVLRQPSGQWFGSLLDVMTHLASAEHIWLVRLRDGATPGRHWVVADFPDAPALLSTWRDLDAQWETFVAMQTPEQLSGMATWRRTNGQEMTLPMWQVLLHLAFHGAEHRAEAALILTNAGVAHGEQGFYPVFLPPQA